LDASLRLKAMPRLRFAGQITGVEGYVESAAIGLLAGRFAAAERLARLSVPPPPTTALGALIVHITGGHLAAETEGGGSSFQPMNVNYGLFPEIEAPELDAEGRRIKGKERGRAKKRAMSVRAIADIERWLAGSATQAAAE
ncbi:MAG: FAD-dependent oxidoreductase, partial [Hyphomicrobium sp.]